MSDTTREHAELPDFSGQLVYLDVGVPEKNEVGSEAIPLEFTEWRRVADRWFLVGRVTTAFDIWMSNCEAGVAWDSVTSYFVFKSREELQERMARHKPTLKERLGLRRL